MTRQVIFMVRPSVLSREDPATLNRYYQVCRRLILLTEILALSSSIFNYQLESCPEHQDVLNHPCHSSNLYKGEQLHVSQFSKWHRLQIHPDCNWLQNSLMDSSTFHRSHFKSSVSCLVLVSNLSFKHNLITPVPLLKCFPVFLSSSILLRTFLC